MDGDMLHAGQDTRSNMFLLDFQKVPPSLPSLKFLLPLPPLPLLPHTRQADDSGSDRNRWVFLFACIVYRNCGSRPS